MPEPVVNWRMVLVMFWEGKVCFSIGPRRRGMQGAMDV